MAEQKEAETKRAAEEEKKRQDQLTKEKAEKEIRDRQEKEKQAQSEVKAVDETNKMGITATTLGEYEKNKLMLARLHYETDQALSSSTFKMYKFDLQKVGNFINP